MSIFLLTLSECAYGTWNCSKSISKRDLQCDASANMVYTACVSPCRKTCSNLHSDLQCSQVFDKASITEEFRFYSYSVCLCFFLEKDFLQNTMRPICTHTGFDICMKRKKITIISITFFIFENFYVFFTNCLGIHSTRCFGLLRMQTPHQLQ